MPTSIPVQVGQHQFSSMNQARIFYRDILYRYDTGHTVSPADRAQVVNLLTSAAIGSLPPGAEDPVCVVKGSFGRKCFEVRRENETGHLISIIRAVKSCVAGGTMPTDLGTINRT